MNCIASTMRDVILHLQEDDMARRRLQQSGDLYKQGGWWKLRWRVDAISKDGDIRRAWSKPVIIGPAAKGFGMPPMSAREAKRQSWEQWLSKLDQNNRTPLSMVTLADFVERRFKPGHVEKLKPAGQKHYATQLAHIVPFLGKLRLCDVRKEHVEQLVNRFLNGKYKREHNETDKDGKAVKVETTHCYTKQTALHIRNAVSAIFTYAESEQCFSGSNPAKHVKVRDMSHASRPALSFAQARLLLDHLSGDDRDLVLFAVMTSMNISEVLGLKWKRVNLSTDEHAMIDRVIIPPQHLFVNRQCYRGDYGSVKAKGRVRSVPINDVVREVLQRRHREAKRASADDFVFACRTGQPIDEHNTMARHIKPVARELGMPWISWHVFRHTHSTWTKTVGLPDFDRMKIMGHSSLSMTDRYTHGDTERRREAMNQISRKLFAVEGPIQ